MINVIIGTKAELIKMSPVMRELEKRKIEYNYIDTSQHTQITEKIRRDFQVKEPDFSIGGTKNITGIMQGLYWSTKITKNLLNSKIFKNQKKGLTLVIGDTATTFLGAYCSKIKGKKVGHIEAGLRSFNYFHPFPEEIIRVWVSRISDYMFAPYKWAFDNLAKYSGKKFNTKYNTILDTIRFSLEKNRKPKLPKKYCIVTTHRFETIFNKERLSKILSYVEQAAEQIKVVFVMHEPTKKRLINYGLLEGIEKNENILIAPLMHYFEWIQAEKNAQFIMTDGGSIQEESYYLNTPCCLLRNTSERKEGLEENVVISNLEQEKITDFLKNYKKYKRKKISINYSPSKYIVDKIIENEKDFK